MNTRVGALKPNIVTTQLEANAAKEASNTYLLASPTMVIMDPYEAEALMRFNAIVSLNELWAKANTLIDTVTSLNFVSKEIAMANCFYKDCKTSSKLAIRVASEQRISTIKVVCLLVFTIDGQ